MLGAVARDAGHDVTVLDPWFNQTTPESFASFLKENRFHVIGLTVYTLTYRLAKQLLAAIKAVLPNAFTVVGGPHPTSLPAETLRDIHDLDCVVYGEGELTFVEILDRLQHGAPLDSVRGIVYRPDSDGQIVVNPPRELLVNLDDLPPPAYDLFPIKEYVPTPNLVRRYPTVATQVTRGCPYNCAFCQYNLALGRNYRHASPDRIVEELIHLKQRYGTRGIVFRDSTLTLNVPFLRKLCENLIAHKVDLTWMCYSRTDVIARHGKELLPLMKKAGCWQIGYGCESGNQKSLDLLRKKTTVEHNVVAVEETLRAGMNCSTTWIIGIPGESYDEAWNSVRLACRLGSHVAKFFLPVPYPGTDLERICRELGGLREDASEDDYEIYMPENPVYVNPMIGKEATVRLLQRAYRLFYTRPKVLYRNLLNLRDGDSVKKYWDFFRLMI